MSGITYVLDGVMLATFEGRNLPSNTLIVVFMRNQLQYKSTKK